MKRIVGILAFGLAFFFLYKFAYWHLMEGKSFITGLAVAISGFALVFCFFVFWERTRKTDDHDKKD